MGLVVWPLVGRAADIKPPGEIAKPALIVMAVGMLWVSFLPSTADDAWTYIRILPGLLMIGVGMGIGFPALNVGAMGAVAGPEIGLASGVLNTARQLGAAIGVAILIATFGGVLHAHMSWFADDEIEDVVDDWDMPAPMAQRGDPVDAARLHGRHARPLRAQARASTRRSSARRPARRARATPGRSARPALLVLTVLPLLGALRRTPAQARAEFMEQMQARQEAAAARRADRRTATRSRATATVTAPRGARRPWRPAT